MISQNWFAVAAFCLFVSSVAWSDELPAVEDYAAPSEVTEIAISPDGEKLAYRRTVDGQTSLAVKDSGTGEVIYAADMVVADFDRLYFINRDALLLFSRTPMMQLPGPQRRTRLVASILELEKRKLHALSLGRLGIDPVGTGFSLVAGLSEDRSTIFVPASIPPTRNRAARSAVKIFGVSAGVRKPELISTVKRQYSRIYVDRNGVPIVLEYRKRNQGRHQIWSYSHGTEKAIFDSGSSSSDITVLGMLPGGHALLFASVADDFDPSCCSEMSLLDGSIRKSVIGRDGLGVSRILRDLNQTVHAIEYQGTRPTYDFFDPELGDRIRGIQAGFPASSVSLVDWTPDFQRLVLFVTGGWSAGNYVLSSKGSESPQVIANAYPRITGRHLTPVKPLELVTRDGVPMDASLTIRDDVRGAGPAPLVLLLNESDMLEIRNRYDWMEQYLASRGFAVLRASVPAIGRLIKQEEPRDFSAWMQNVRNDLDDGVRTLVRNGVVDPHRVCIVGDRFGGFAALSSAAHSPFAYKCVVSIGGPSDAPKMFREFRQKYGTQAVEDLERIFVAGSMGKAALNAESPFKSAHLIDAAVLLIHAEDDPEVPIEHSRKMHYALRVELKRPRFIEIDGNRRYPTSLKSRTQMLESISEFLKTNL